MACASISLRIRCLHQFAFTFLCAYAATDCKDAHPTAEIIFHVKRLTQSEWNYIFKLSFPIIILEEIMKAVTRCLSPILPSLCTILPYLAHDWPLRARVSSNTYELVVRTEGDGGDF